MNTLIHPAIETLPTTGSQPSTDWKKVEDTSGNHISGFVPGWTNLNLFYYNVGSPTGTQWDIFTATGTLCDSREVVFDVPQNLAMHEIAIPGGSYKLSLTFTQSNFNLWYNSSLHLKIKN